MSRALPAGEDELDAVMGESEPSRSGRRGEGSSFSPTVSRKKSRTPQDTGAVDNASKGIVRESRFPYLKTIYLQSRTSLNPVWLWEQGVRTLMLHRSTWSSGLPYLIVGLVLAFIGEVMKSGPQHNVVVLLVLMAAFAFPNFPDKTVRPQLVIVLITCISFLLDIGLFADPDVSIGPKAVTAMVFLAKALALYQFLWYTKNAAKARKYFIRRVRVFLIPWARPKNIMREMRSRILAIELLQFAAIIAYLTLFFVAIIHLGYSDLVTGPKQGVAMAAFLPLKTVSSGLVFYGLFTDTDVVLCLAHFGILGGCMKSVKTYVRKKFEEYEGWPLAYGLNKYRFYVVTFIKFVDWCWGLAGWAALGTTLGERYYGLGDNLKAFVGSCVFILCLTDIYIPILFGVIYWMLGENKHRLEVIVKEHQRTGELTAEFDDGDHASDDSELDDFGFRAAVESTDADVEQSVELGRAKGSFSPDRFARASRVDFSKTVRWDEDAPDEENKRKSKKKRKKKKPKKHRFETDSEEEEDEFHGGKGLMDEKFSSSRTSANVSEQRLQSLVDDSSMPHYMRRDAVGRDQRGHEDSEGDETAIDFAKETSAPPSRGSSFVSPRLAVSAPPPAAPLPALQHSISPPAPGPRGVIKVPPLQFRRSASSDASYPHAKFSRPLIGSQNSMEVDNGAPPTLQKANSISVGVGDSVLDWRSGESSHGATVSPKSRQVCGEDEPGSFADPQNVVFVPRELSADDYSVLWESLEPVLSSQYELSASSALSQDDMLVVIIKHLNNNEFGVAASGIIDRALTVFSYASYEGTQTRRPDTCLVELKLIQLDAMPDEGGKMLWQLEFICKCTDGRYAVQCLRRLQLHMLLGTEELTFDDL